MAPELYRATTGATASGGVATFANLNYACETMNIVFSSGSFHQRDLE
jgi:hypothetical protein